MQKNKAKTGLNLLHTDAAVAIVPLMAQKE
jgi:hypothetical protein